MTDTEFEQVPGIQSKTLVVGAYDRISTPKMFRPLTVDGGGRLRVVICDSDGNPYGRTESGNTPISIENIVVFDQVDGDELNTNVWTTSVSGMTVDQENGEIVVNNAGSTTANHYAILKTIKSVPFYGEFPVEIDIGAKLNVVPIANTTIEWGVGNVSGTSAPTDGCFFRYQASDQTLRAVICFGGVETVSDPILIQGDDPEEEPEVPDINEYHDWDIVIDNDEVVFEVDGEEVAEIDTPEGDPYPVGSTRLPIFCRIYNGSSGPAQAAKISVGRMVVTQLVVNQNRPWADTLVLMGRSIYQSPVSAFGQTAQWANSSAPDAAALSNTVPSYTTLGGIFRFAAVAGANTDYALFGFQVPANYQLVIGGVAISTVVTGADIGSTATVLAWALGLNSSGASLATAESPPSTWAPKRVALGMQGFQKAIVQGEQAPQIERIFSPPLVVDGGRYVHVILRIPAGLATQDQVIYGTVTFNGYFD